MSKFETILVATAAFAAMMAVSYSGWHPAIRLPLAGALGLVSGLIMGRAVSMPWRKP